MHQMQQQGSLKCSSNAWDDLLIWSIANSHASVEPWNLRSMLDGLEIISLDSTIPYKDGSRSVTSGPKLLGFNAGGIRDLHENYSYDEMQTFGNVTRIATTHTDHMPTPLAVSAVTSGGLSGAHTSGTTGFQQPQRRQQNSATCSNRMDHAQTGPPETPSVGADVPKRDSTNQ